MELYVRVRRACMVEGMSTREAARVFGLHRDTVRKMLQYSVPSGSKPFSRVHIICIENRTWRNFLSQRGTPRARRAAAANLRIRRSRAS